MNEDKPVILYHHNCPDGILSAELIKKYMLINCEPIMLGQHPKFGLNQFIRSIITKREVFVLDLAMDQNISKELCHYAKTVFYIDHHTIDFDIEKLEQKNLFFYHDLTKSTAKIIIDFLATKGIILSLSTLKCIELVNNLDMHIKMNDLETNIMEGWMSICKSNNSYYDYNILENCFYYDELQDCLKINNLGKYIIFEGKQSLSRKQTTYAELCKKIKITFIDGNKTAVIEHYEKNDLANYILDTIPDIEIAVVWGKLGSKITSSWRSRTINLIPIVSKFGGGGHVNACGLILNDEILKVFGFID